MPHATQLVATESALLVVDVQTKLMAKIPGADAVVLNHFRTGISAVQMPSWDDVASTQPASNNTND